MTNPGPAAQSMRTLVAPSNMPAQGPGEELVESEHDGGCGLGELERRATRERDEFLGWLGDGRCDISEGERAPAASQGADGPAEERVLGRIEAPAEDASDERRRQALTAHRLGGSPR